MGDDNPPECLDRLESRLRALLVDESFTTQASPLDVLMVWSEKISTYGLKLHITKTKKGTGVTLGFDNHNNLGMGLDWEGFAFFAAVALAVFCMGFTIGGGFS